MAFLAINGVELHVQEGSLDETIREIGETEFAYDGSMKKSRQSVKRDLGFESTPLIQTEAYAWDSLIRGLGQTWDFNSNFYGSKGLGPSSSTGCSINGTEKKYGASGLAITSGNSITYSSVYTSGGAYCVMFWNELTAGGGFGHYISNNGTWYNNGSGVSDPGITTISGGNVSLNAIGATRYWDDLVILPFALPTSWISSIYTFVSSNAFSLLPKLTMTGDCLEESTSRSVIGMAEKHSFLKAVVGGSFQTNARTLSVVLKQT